MGASGDGPGAKGWVGGRALVGRSSSVVVVGISRQVRRAIFLVHSNACVCGTAGAAALVLSIQSRHAIQQSQLPGLNYIHSPGTSSLHLLFFSYSHFLSSHFPFFSLPSFSFSFLFCFPSSPFPLLLIIGSMTSSCQTPKWHVNWKPKPNLCCHEPSNSAVSTTDCKKLGESCAGARQRVIVFSHAPSELSCP